MNAAWDELARLLRTWITWYRLRRAAQGGMHGLLAGLSAACLLGVSVLAWSWLTRPEYLRLGAGLVLGAALAGALGGMLLPAAPLNVARFYDRRFHLLERFSTALELHDRRDVPVIPEAQGLIDNQLEDALQHARQVKPPPGFYFPWRGWQAAALTALLALNIGLLFLGQVPFERAARQRQVEQAIEQAAERLETLATQVAQDPALDEAQREQILQALDRASQELSEADTLEQAVASLSAAEAALRQMEDTLAQQQADALQQAGSRLQQSLSTETTSPLEGFASQLAQGDLNAAAEALQALDPAGLTAEETSALAEALESAAESLAESSPDLAASLSQAAEALQEGNPQAAQQALQQAASQVAQTGQQAAGAQAAGQAAAQVAQGQQSLLQAGGQGTLPGSSAGAQPGQGSQAGGGSQPGQSGGASGSTAGGSGAGAGESTGSEAQGGAAGTSPIQPGMPGDGGLTAYTPLFAPQRLGGSAGETVALPSSSQPGALVLGTGISAPGQPGAAAVPYRDVYSAYAQAYWQAYDASTIPLSLREIARLYFSALGATNP